jgi:hypothetical protein
MVILTHTDSRIKSAEVVPVDPALLPYGGLGE